MKKVHGDHYFYANDGHVLKSKDDLLGFLKEIDENTFHHHVNAERNDFANWVKEVLKEKALAKKIDHLKDIDSMISAIEKSLKNSKNKKKSRKGIIAEIVDAIRNG